MKLETEINFFFFFFSVLCVTSLHPTWVYNGLPQRPGQSQWGGGKECWELMSPFLFFWNIEVVSIVLSRINIVASLFLQFPFFLSSLPLSPLLFLSFFLPSFLPSFLISDLKTVLEAETGQRKIKCSSVIWPQCACLSVVQLLHLKHVHAAETHL